MAIESEPQVWMVNTHTAPLDAPLFEMNPPRIVHFKPRRPIPFPRSVALRFIGKYNTIKICENPETYFAEVGFNHLMIRGGGIGDIILLEPIIRQLGLNKQKITLATLFPELMDGHPAVTKTIKLEKIHDVPSYGENDYEIVTDLRYWSERHDKRAEWHRTDIFAQYFRMELKDFTPKLFCKLQTPKVRMEKGEKWIGFQWDASENHRRFPAPRAREVMKHILEKDPKARLILFGGRKYVDPNGLERTVDLQGKTNLMECLSTIARLDCMVAADSGLLHAAMAMQVPTVAWFSTISAALRLKHYKGQCATIQKDPKDLPCVACGNYNFNGCKHGDASTDPDYKIPLFMAPCSEIQPEEFYAKISQMKPSPGVTFKANGDPIEWLRK